MPSESIVKQRAAGIALKAKREGKVKQLPAGAAKNMAKMSIKDLEKFAKTKHKGLPYRKGKKKKVNEAWGQKLEFYLQIIWRWLERQGYAEAEIDAILNDPTNIEIIESGEAVGENPIMVAKQLNTEEIMDAMYSSGPAEEEIEELEEVPEEPAELEGHFYESRLTAESLDDFLHES